MHKSGKLLIGIAGSAMVLGCFAMLWFLPRIGTSPGVPQGSCSVKTVLLSAGDFPPGTVVSSSSDFEHNALDTASHTFSNESPQLEVYQAAEYYNTQFAAWGTYEYRSGIFKQSATNGPWKEWGGITFSSSAANQDHFACSADTVLGDRCMLIARYGRYFVFFRANLSDSFTVENIQPLLKRIDERMSSCSGK